MPAATGTVSIPSIKLDGQIWDIADLVELRISRTVGTSAAARLRIDDTRGGGAAFKLDGEMKISIDVLGTLTEVFAGKVVALGVEFAHGRTECVVDAYDASYKLSQQTVVKTHLEKSAADIVREIAQSAGLSVQVADELSKFKYESIQQRGTPLRFLTSLCQAAGCEWFIDGARLVVRRRQSGGPVATLSGSDQLRRFSARYSVADEVNEVTTRGWDVKEKKAVVGTATGSATKTPSTAPIANHSAATTSKGTSWPRNIVSIDDAETVAAGIAHRMGASVLTARGECLITPSLVPGAMVAIGNVSPAWNGNYYVTSVEHVFGGREGFVTRFTAGALEPDSLVDLVGGVDRSSAARFADGVTIGVVTNNEDKEGLNRVKLKLPYLSDSEETGWARLVQQGAGNARGLLTLPEVNDEVLVAFEHGDIRRPYVLGGLWNGKDKPPLDSQSQALRNGGKVTSRSFTSRNGHTLMFSDEGPDGEWIMLELGTDKVSLLLADKEIVLNHDEGDITIKNKQASVKLAKNGDITMKGQKINIEAQQDLTVKGANVKIEAQANMDLKASAQLTAKASAKATIDGGGMTEVKGGMVKVN